MVTGPNGSGKTTMLKVICSLLPLSSGRVVFCHDGVDYTGGGILPHVGYAAPDLFLYDELTAVENLRFFARVSGTPQLNFEDDLAAFGLDGRGKDLVGSYSSGMKQRLKYLLALMRRPPLLLLDEPTANLDDEGRTLVDSVIRNHDGITVIATNDEDDLKYADRTIRLG